MTKLKRKLTVAFVIVLLALLFMAKPFAAELASGEWASEIGHSMYDTLSNGPAEDQ